MSVPLPAAIRPGCSPIHRTRVVLHGRDRIDPRADQDQQRTNRSLKVQHLEQVVEDWRKAARSSEAPDLGMATVMKAVMMAVARNRLRAAAARTTGECASKVSTPISPHCAAAVRRKV